MRVPIIVAVMALVHDPRHTWSVTCIGSDEPILRIPRAPIAASRLPLRMAPINPGKWYLSRTGARMRLTRSSACTARAVADSPLSRPFVWANAATDQIASPVRRRRKRNVATSDHDDLAGYSRVDASLSRICRTFGRCVFEVWRRHTLYKSLVDRTTRRNVEHFPVGLVGR